MPNSTDRALAALLLALALLPAAVRADSFGIALNGDGPTLHYTRPNIEYGHWSGRWLGLHRQRLELMHSQEAGSRNLTLIASAELLDHGWRAPSGRFEAAPLLAAGWAKLFKRDLMAVVAGGRITVPPGQLLPWEIAFEGWLAPKIATFGGDADYLWRLNAEIAFELPENNRLEVGLRKVRASLDGIGSRTIEQGLYLGLTTLF